MRTYDDPEAASFTAVGQTWYQTVFDKHHTVMLIIDPCDGQIVHANNSACRFYGWSLPELLQKKITEINTLSADAVMAEMALAQKQRRNFFQFVHRRSDGSVRDVEAHSTPVSFRERIYLCSVIIDVTGYKQVEQMLRETTEKLERVLNERTGEIVALRQEKTEKALIEKELKASERKYRQLIQDAQIIILHLDESARILFCNQYGLDFFGYAESELRQQLMSETVFPAFNSIGNNASEKFWDEINEMGQSRKVIREIVKKDGRRAWIEWSNRFQKDGETGENQIVAVGVDVTERHRLIANAKLNFERQRRKVLIQNLLEKRVTQEELIQRASQEGWVLETPFACCLVVFDFSNEKLLFLQEDSDELQAWMDTAADLIRVQLGGFAWRDGAGIAILQSFSDKEPATKESGVRLWEEMVASSMRDVFRGVDFRMGVSTIKPDILSAYEEALEAATVGSVLFSERKIHRWRELGAGRLLLKHIDGEAGTAFVHDYIGPLVENDSAKNVELLLTLEVILQSESLEKAAESLHVHRKTIDFRRRKIEVLLQVRLDNPEIRVNLIIAMKIWRLQSCKK